MKIPLLRSRLIGVYPAGLYEYVIARTRFIDGEFKKALEEGVEQVLIFGAGFDSRGVRFQGLSKHARVFELDVPVTQAVKIGRFKEKGIGIPDNLVFVPIDFETQSIRERLMESGFAQGKQSLFLLEGLTMYLQPESVDKTFRIIRELAGEGSRVVFDHVYASVVRQENRYEGEKELYRSVFREGEGFCFGIEKGRIDEFLVGYGLKAISVMDSEALSEMFFPEAPGKPPVYVNGTHCIVTAES
jgi:methyltransferase (TIGR00027 family)